MSGQVTRARHYACIHPETYKYFLPRQAVVPTWARLERRYGPIARRAGFGVMEIQHPRLILRATIGGNPITVIRTRHCELGDVDELHALLDYRAPAGTDSSDEPKW